MTQVNIDGLTNATLPLDGTELVEVEKDGVNQKVAVTDILSAQLPSVWEDRTGANLVAGVYTVVSSDVGKGLNFTVAADVRFPGGLPLGSVVIRKKGTGDVTTSFTAPMVLDRPGGRTKLTTQFEQMAAIGMTADAWTLSGAEA